MSSNLSSYREDQLKTAQDIFRYLDTNPFNQQFRSRMREDFGFYEGGLKQWDQSDLIKLIQRGQSPITVNIIKTLIDNLSGVEIQSRYRASCRSTNPSNELEVKLAKALASYLYIIQEDNSAPYIRSLAFRDELICGLGIVNVYKDKGIFKIDYVHPYDVSLDCDDSSPQYDNMRKVARRRWIAVDLIKSIWKRNAKDLDTYNSIIQDETISPEYADRASNITMPCSTSNIRLVVETQYKVEHRAYSGIDSNGRSFKTFDEEVAHKISVSKKEIKEIKADRIMRTIFVGNTLLEHSPLTPDLPDAKDFSIIPSVWSRPFEGGIPFGPVAQLKDIQRCCNSSLTRSYYLLNSSKLVIAGKLPPGSTVEKLRKELQREESIVVLDEDTKYDLNTTMNINLAKEGIETVKEYMAIGQRVVGVYDDQLGKQTNAVSGIAKNISQVNSVRNNVFAYDAFAFTEKRIATSLINMIKGGYDENIALQILSPEDNESIILNISRQTSKGTVIFNDISTLPLSLYIEEVPDYKNSFEEDRDKLEVFLNSPQADLLVFSPELMRQLGFRNANQISEEFKKAFSERMMMQQGQISLPAQANTLPSPDQMQLPGQQIINGGM